MIFWGLFQQSTPALKQREFDVNGIWSSINDLGEAFLTQLPYIAIGIIVFILFLAASRTARRFALKAGERTKIDLTLSELLGRLASFVISIAGFFVAAVIIFPGFQPGDLVAGLGITSVAIGFAFKDVLQNFFAGILILWRRPFIVGDQIKIKDIEGTVEEINVRSTKLRTPDGERAIIPNGEAYTNVVLVRTAYNERRVRFTVGIDNPNSIDEVKDTIRHILNETKGILNDPNPKVYIAELTPSAVKFDVHFWMESFQINILEVSDRVATKIKSALDQLGVGQYSFHRS